MESSFLWFYHERVSLIRRRAGECHVVSQAPFPVVPAHRLRVGSDRLDPRRRTFRLTSRVCRGQCFPGVRLQGRCRVWIVGRSRHERRGPCGLDRRHHDSGICVVLVSAVKRRQAGPAASPAGGFPGSIGEHGPGRVPAGVGRIERLDARDAARDGAPFGLAALLASAPAVISARVLGNGRVGGHHG